MSCSSCVKNHKPSCDPEPNTHGGCVSFRANWEPEDDEPEIEDVFAQMKVFKPEESN